MIAYEVIFKVRAATDLGHMTVYAEDREFALDQALYELGKIHGARGPVEIISVEEDDDDLLYNLL